MRVLSGQMSPIGWTLVLVAMVWMCLVTEAKKDRIKLRDLQVITLRPNQYTTGRRSSSVPQLKCIGGHCDAIAGQTVQCYNRGHDGRDVQWECKTEMNNVYKFGQLDVTCEGYDFPDDDYILVGSCGLEYSIDSSAAKPNSWSKSSNTYLPTKPTNGFSFGFVLTVGIIIFIIYYSCLRTPRNTPDGQPRRPTGAPPPPGFRSDTFNDTSNGPGCSSSSTGSAGFSGFTYERPHHSTHTAQNNGNGFFSGLLAGGTLGYLFGSRNDTNYRNQNSYFGSRSTPFSSRGFDSGSSSSSTTTTTSGFGGTKRR